MSTTKLTNKQKLNLECLAEDIHVFITTSAKPGKNIKCTSKKSEVKNLLVAEEQFAYLIKTIKSNMALLNLEFNVLDQVNSEGTLDEVDLITINTKMVTLGLNSKAVLAKRKFKLPSNYYFYYDEKAQRTYFVTCK
jgi:hypothetical protein